MRYSVSPRSTRWRSPAGPPPQPAATVITATTASAPARTALGLLPAVAAAQLHEPTVAEVFLGDPVRLAPDADQALELLLPHREDEPPARPELLDQRAWALRRPGGHDDRIVRCLGRPPERAVPDLDRHAVAIAEGVEQVAGPERQLGDALEREHAGAELGQHGGLVPRAGSHLEHALIAVRELQRLAHEGHHVRLRDRLARADRQRRVLVRMRLQSRLDEQVAGDAAHRLEDAPVGDTPCRELRRDHAVAVVLERVAHLTATRSRAPSGRRTTCSS